MKKARFTHHWAAPIEVFKQGRFWVARFNDPEILAAWGTDTIQTPYLANGVSGEFVVEQIQSRNPDATVKLVN